jgi:hypothetical protein
VAVKKAMVSSCVTCRISLCLPDFTVRGFRRYMDWPVFKTLNHEAPSASSYDMQQKLHKC